MHYYDDDDGINREHSLFSCGRHQFQLKSIRIVIYKVNTL